MLFRFYYISRYVYSGYRSVLAGIRVGSVSVVYKCCHRFVGLYNVLKVFLKRIVGISVDYDFFVYNVVVDVLELVYYISRYVYSGYRSVLAGIRVGSVSVVYKCCHRFVGLYNVLKVFLKRIVGISVDYDFFVYDVVVDVLELVDYISRYVYSGYRSVLAGIRVGSVSVVYKCCHRFVGLYNVLKVFLKRIVGISVDYDFFVYNVVVDVLELVYYISRYVYSGYRSVLAGIRVGSVSVVYKCCHRFVGLYNVLKVFLKRIVGISVDYNFFVYDVVVDVLELVYYISRYVYSGYCSVLAGIRVGSVSVVYKCCYRFIGLYNVLKVFLKRTVGIAVDYDFFVYNVVVDVLELVYYISWYVYSSYRSVLAGIRVGSVSVVYKCCYRFVGLYNVLKVFFKRIVGITINRDLFVYDVVVDVLELVDHISRYVYSGYCSVLAGIRVGSVSVVYKRCYRFVGLYNVLKVFLKRVVGIAVDYNFFVYDVVVDVLELVDYISRYVYSGYCSVLTGIRVGSVSVVYKRCYRFVRLNDLLKLVVVDRYPRVGRLIPHLERYLVGRLIDVDAHRSVHVHNLLKVFFKTIIGITVDYNFFIYNIVVDILEVVRYATNKVDRVNTCRQCRRIPAVNLCLSRCRIVLKVLLRNIILLVFLCGLYQ